MITPTLPSVSAKMWRKTPYTPPYKHAAGGFDQGEGTIYLHVGIVSPKKTWARYTLVSTDVLCTMLSSITRTCIFALNIWRLLIVLVILGVIFGVSVAMRMLTMAMMLVVCSVI